MSKNNIPHAPASYKTGTPSGGKRKVKRPVGAHFDKTRYSPLDIEKGTKGGLSNGPTTDRGCTDILCCLIFTAFLGCYTFIVFYGLTKGNPHLLVTPFDSDKKGCGFTPGYEDHKYIYFWRFTDLAGAGGISDLQFLKATFCVSECPKYDGNPADADLKTIEQLGITCKDTVETSGNSGCKAVKAYPTGVWLGRFCLMKFSWVETLTSELKAGLSSVLDKLESSDTIQSWAKDTQTCWWIILVSVVITLLISFLYMHILRCFADIVTWVLILLLIAIMIVIGWFCLDWAKNKKTSVDEADKATGKDTSTSTKTKITAMKWVGWIFISLGILTFLIVLCICHKIRLITAIIETTAHFINNTMTVLWVPIINTFVAIILAAGWIVGTVYLYSVGEIEAREDWPISNVKWTAWTKRFWYFNMFAILWIVAFVLSLGDFIIAVACCIWYWNQGASSQSKKKEEKKVSKSISPVFTGYKWAFRYHMGSIAIGSFFIALIWAARLIMAYVHKKLKDTGATKNKMIQYLMTCIHCCLACFERFIRFVNKQAFIYIGITGKNFFTSTINAFKVVLRHPIEFALLAGLGHLFMYMGIAVMIFGTVACSYFLMKIDSIEEQLSSPLFPLILIAVLAYFISDLFVDIYLVACYAILHCYYVDIRLSEKSRKVAQNAPKELKQFLKTKKTRYEEVEVDDSFDSADARKEQEEYK